LQLYKNFKPAVSIILPTYNRAGLLNRAVDSVLNQSFNYWELMIVDDGSNDNTFEIINNYLMENENIRYLKHRNRYVSLSLNAGIKASCGKYITYLNSDDEYKKDHLKLRFEYMEKNPGIDFIHGGFEVIGDEYVKDKNDLSKKIHLSECKVGGTFFYKREVAEKIGGYKDLKYGDDTDFYYRAEKKFKIAKVDFPTYIYYRDTPDSICNNI
jgi:glycosyltransferase involved in cell wall biosynthesis